MPLLAMAHESDSELKMPKGVGDVCKRFGKSIHDG